MKKLILLTLFFVSSHVYAADTHYFDSEATDSTEPCPLADPCYSLTDTTLDNSDAATDDTFLLKAGSEWCGDSDAEWIINSSGVTVGRYGTGANPIIAGACVTTPTWTSAGGGIYYTTGQTQAYIGIVMVDDSYSLNRVGIKTDTVLNNALPAGSFCRSNSATAGTNCGFQTGTGSFLFVRLADDSDPSTHNIRIGDYRANNSNGDRGQLRVASGKTDVKIVDIDLLAINGTGFSTAGLRTKTAGMFLNGSARDNYFPYCNTGTGEDGSYWRSYRDEVVYGASNGRGQGQGITIGCHDGAFLGTEIHDNWMAGIDTLDLGTTTDVSNVVYRYLNVYENGQDKDSGSFDPNIYNDGGSEIVIMDSVCWGAGNATSNVRPCIYSGSERPTTDPAENVDLINVLAYGTPNSAWASDNPTSSTVAMGLHRAYGNTLAANTTGSSVTRVWSANEYPTTADLFVMRKNIRLAMSSAAMVNASVDVADTIYDGDYNIDFRTGGSTSVYRRNGTDMTITTWRSTTGEDANSSVANPLLVNVDNDADMNAFLQDGSPAIDACVDNTDFTPQSFISTSFSDIFPTTASKTYGRGTTRASGALDNPASSLDCGWHKNYAYLYPADVVPSSNITGETVSLNVSFTTSDTAILYDDKIKITLPSGFLWDNNGTTAISNVVGMNGTFTLGVSGQVLTITRVGDGYSTLPADISFTLSNVRNPTVVGNPGSPLIELYESDGTTKIATSEAEFGMAIAGDNFVASTGQTIGSFSCSGPFTIS